MVEDIDATLLHMIAWCLLQIVLKFGLHQSTPSSPKWPISCWFECWRHSMANCGLMHRDSAMVTMEIGEPVGNHHRCFEWYHRWRLMICHFPKCGHKCITQWVMSPFLPNQFHPCSFLQCAELFVNISQYKFHAQRCACCRRCRVAAGKPVRQPTESVSCHVSDTRCVASSSGGKVSFKNSVDTSTTVTRCWTDSLPHQSCRRFTWKFSPFLLISRYTTEHTS